MPNTWGYYRNIDGDEEAKELTEQNGHPCVEGEMYNTSEYGDTPCWVEVTLRDEGVLSMKLARGILSDLDFHAIELYRNCVEITVSEEWGNYADAKVKVYGGSAWVQFYAKHTNEMIEINISDQFNQAIGV